MQEHKNCLIQSMIPFMSGYLPEKGTKLNPRHIDTIHRYGSMSLLVLVMASFIFIFWRLTKLHMDFYNNLWAPVYLLIQGKSPYATAILEPSLPALWFPMAVGVFSPLGLLSETVATKVWFIITVIELFAVLLLILHDRLKFHETAIIGCLFFLFPPLLNHIVLGQFSVTAVFCLMFSAYAAEKRKDWAAAFFLALGLAKPQLGILAMTGMGLYYFRCGGVKALIRFGMQTAGMVLLMSLPLFLAYPRWISDWTSSLRSNFSWLHPSLFSVLKNLLGAWGYFFWCLFAGVVFAICYQIWGKLPPLPAMAWSLGLTTLVTPYLWSWDFVLLLPVWTFTFADGDWKRKSVLIACYWVGWLGFYYVQYLPVSSNDMFWWFPLWFMIATALVAFWKRQERDGVATKDTSETPL